jgi:prenyltransferase beta subunit
MKQVEFLRPGEDLGSIFAAALPFVMARRKATGGFGATPRLPATIEDTYHALKILELAREHGVAAGEETDPTRDSNLRSNLAGCRRSLPAGSRTRFQLLWCCRTAGLALNDGSLEEMVIDLMAASVFLEDWYYGIRILDEVLGRPRRPTVEKERLAAILDRGWRTVGEAWMHIRLSSSFRKALPLPEFELITWLQACQNGDGGFGFFPRTTSFVENCHAALRALAFLDAEPRDTAGAFFFLASCQTVGGGFGRSSRAAPFLDTTWHALAAISFLNA